MEIWCARMFTTCPTRWMMTSRTSTQPLSDSTSNRANMALPTLSKLKLRGLALRKNIMETSISGSNLKKKKNHKSKKAGENKRRYQTLGTQNPGLVSPCLSFRFKFFETLTFMRNIPWQSSYKQQQRVRIPELSSKWYQNCATATADSFLCWLRSKSDSLQKFILSRKKQM